MIGQPSPAAAFAVIKLRKKMKPAALLAETLSQSGGDDGGGFGVKLADFMASVVVFGVSKVGIATLRLAPRGIHQSDISGPRSAVKPVDEIVLGGREIGTAAQFEPDPGGEIHRCRNFLRLGDHEVTATTTAASRHGVQGEQGGVTVRRAIVVGRRAGVGAWVVN